MVLLISGTLSELSELSLVLLKLYLYLKILENKEVSISTLLNRVFLHPNYLEILSQ